MRACRDSKFAISCSPARAVGVQFGPVVFADPVLSTLTLAVKHLFVVKTINQKLFPPDGRGIDRFLRARDSRIIDSIATFSHGRQNDNGKMTKCQQK
jgi:hypothetical protein